MSASTERKLRSAAIQAGTDRKTLAAREEAAKKAKSKRNWTIGTIIVVVLVAAIIILGSTNIIYNRTAAKVGDTKYSAAEVSYVYAAQYWNFYSSYGSYASYFGLDTSSGLAGLADQECSWMEDGTWRDYFMESAMDELQQVTALCAYADENGITLTDEEIAEIDSSLDSAAESATYYGYSSLNNYFSSNYGKGVTTKIVRAYNMKTQLASKAIEYYESTLQYTDEELEEYYQGLEGASDIFDYYYYSVAAETVESTDDDGNTTSDVTDDTLAAAKATADEILVAYTSDRELEDYEAKLDSAIQVITGTEDTCSHNSSASGSGLGVYSEWMMDSARKTGDATVVENSAGTGYNVCVFIGRDDNHYNTVSVRHILIQTEADDDGNYTEEAKAAAKASIDEIYAEWQASDMTEETFAELANTYSEDSGSNTNGGLYENIYKNEMVSAFNDFCFAEGRQPGDVDIVYGQSSGYEGYHIIYFVGEGELYSNYIARNDLVSDAESTWSSELYANYEVTTTSGLRYAGK